MEVLLLNGSPRAPVSHSKELARMFQEACPLPGKYRAISSSNHKELCQLAGKASHLLLVFPLYVDGIPATLLEFLKALEREPPREKPTISLLINCGFLEPEQNDTAVEILRLFCEQAGYPFGSVLKVASGEAILSTPFRFLVQRKVKRFARAVALGGTLNPAGDYAPSKRGFPAGFPLLLDSVWRQKRNHPGTDGLAGNRGRQTPLTGQAKKLSAQAETVACADSLFM